MTLKIPVLGKYLMKAGVDLPLIDITPKTRSTSDVPDRARLPCRGEMPGWVADAVEPLARRQDRRRF